MKAKAVSGIMLTLLLVSMLTLAFNIQPVRGWTGTVYIRADGSIDPPDAPIITYDYVTYTLTDNIASDGDGIVVERDNIIIDGASHTLQGPGKEKLWVYPLKGIDLSHRYNVTIKNIKIDSFRPGIYVYNSSRNMINGNIITNSFRTSIYSCGITLEYSSDNIIAYNRILNFTWAGIYLIRFSSRNRITNNHIISTDVRDGIHLYGLSSANITNNVFVNSGLYPRLSFPNLVENNTVNGKPLIYLRSVSDYTIDGSEQEAGQIIVVSSYNITIKSVRLSNTNIGIGLFGAWDSRIINSNFISNNEGVRLDGSNNLIAHNNFENNSYGIRAGGVYAGGINNLIMNNTFMHQSGYWGLTLHGDNNHITFNNFMKASLRVEGTDNYVYLNNLLQSQGGSATDSTTIWNTPMKIFYTYEGNTHSNYTGNYWDDYEGSDTNNDGIGDSPYNIDTDKDYYPLMNPFENYRYYPNIRVTSPNGNESWLVGSYQPIEWKSFLLYTSNVTIKLSIDGGSTWEEVLFANIVNDGVERHWRVMGYPGDNLRIRVATLDDPAVSDMSDSDFSITTASTTNTFLKGYCTWWAFERRAQLGMPVDWLNDMSKPRDARKWIDFAKQAGVSTGSSPETGAIAVWGATATNSFGHVAIVEWVELSEVRGEAWIGVSEMNYGSFIDSIEGITVNFRKVTDRTLTLPRPPEENFLGFIYGFTVPDFSIMASPASLTIQQGNSDTSVITITSINGFDQPVQLTVSGAPSGVTTTLSPEQVTPPPHGTTTSTLTVSAGATATAGSYTLTVTGISGTITHSVGVSLEVKATPTLPGWTFAIITDLHIGRGFDDYGTSGHDDELVEGQDYCLTYRLADAVKWINDNRDKENIEFLVILGDISDTAEKSEFLKAKEILDDLEIPYVPLMGNHDTFSYIGDREELESKGDSYFQKVFWDSPGENLEELISAFGGSWEKQPVPVYSWTLDKNFYFQNYAFSYRGINFVCLDYARRDNIDIASIAEPFSQTNDWLDDHLKKWSGKPVIVFSHYPYIGTGSDLPLPGVGGVYLNEIKRFTDLVSEYNNEVLTFGGHVHALHDTYFDYNVNNVFHTDSIPVVVTKALMEPPCDFLRLVTVNEENIEGIDYESPDLIVEPTAMEVDPNIPSPPNLEFVDWLVVNVQSPVELRVCDSQGRVTGLVNGEVKNEIPRSGYSEGFVVLLAATDSYRYEVVGTDEGHYTLDVIQGVEQQTCLFSATDIPTASRTLHTYVIDWDDLSQGEEGVTVQIDSDGDGVFEFAFTSDSTLVQDEFMSQVTSAEAFPWWILGAVAAVVIGIAVAATFLWRRRK